MNGLPEERGLLLPLGETKTLLRECKGADTAFQTSL